MATNNYIAVPLVGGHKLYSMPLFFDYLLKLDTSPQELLISTTKEIFDKCMTVYTGSLPVTWIHGEEDLGNDMIASTTSAREALRQGIIKRDYEWALWLDNDMLVPPDLWEKFCILRDREPTLILVNSYHPARQDYTDIRHGMATTFTHRDALAAFPFLRCQIRGENYGDDQIWLSVIKSYRNRRKTKTLSGKFFDVKHMVEDGRIKSFKPEHRNELI